MRVTIKDGVMVPGSVIAPTFGNPDQSLQRVLSACSLHHSIIDYLPDDVGSAHAATAGLFQQEAMLARLKEYLYVVHGHCRYSKYLIPM
jgi:hypothetical protein